MKKPSQHDVVIKGINNDWKDILEHSEQAMYIYLDDAHIICNKRFASLLGYASPDAMATVSGSFLQSFVTEKSQRTLVGSYRQAMEKMVGSTTKITWKKKSGSLVDSTVMLIPAAHQGHVFAVHFIS